MSVYVDDYVYFVGLPERIDVLWKEYLDAQENVVQRALGFRPTVDMVDDNHTIYNGSIGVIASKRLLNGKAVLSVSTTGDCYGHGFEDEERSEFNPILLRLDPKNWESGEVSRIQKTYVGSRLAWIKDPNEVFFKNCKNEDAPDPNQITELYEEFHKSTASDHVVRQFIKRKQEEDYRYFAYRKRSFCCDEECEEQ